MIENKFHRNRPVVCPEIGKIVLTLLVMLTDAVVVSTGTIPTFKVKLTPIDFKSRISTNGDNCCYKIDVVIANHTGS